MVKYNKIIGKVAGYMGIDGCLMLLFNYLIVVTSCVLNLNEWYKRGNHSVACSVLMTVL